MQTPHADIRVRTVIGKEGFSTITDPAGAIVDIVFVHGLQGHAEKTWTYQSPLKTKKKGFWPWQKERSKTEEQPSGVFWPFDLLAKRPELAQARILVWGYDSHVTKFFSANNQQNISRHGNDLMVALEQERNQDPSRPLIFVAHSLGGILVKVVLDNSQRTKQSKFLRVYESTKSIVFLGTPHNGSGAANWGSLAGNLAQFALQGTNKKILKALAPNSELLERLRDVFLQILEDGNISIHSFYEAKGMTGIYGLQGRVVPFESARVGHVRHEVSMSINGNHSEICKFPSADDPGYKAVSHAIIEYVKKATREASSGETRLSNRLDSKGSNRNVISRQQSPIDDTKDRGAKGYGKEERHQGNALLQYISALNLPEFSCSELQKLPEGSTNQAAEHLDWLFENPDFIDWYSSSSTGILWLRGESRAENTEAFCCLLKKLIDRGDKASYFFWSPSLGFDQKTNPEDQALQIVRLLIRQLLIDSDRRIQNAMEQYPISELTKAPTYFSTSHSTLRNLFEVLFYSLVAISGSHIYLLIDGVDALGPETYRFLDSFRAMTAKLIAMKSEPLVVKLFFATRPLDVSQSLNDLDHFLDGIPSIEKDKELKNCLQTLHTADFDARPKTIHVAENFTCQWLWTDDAYSEWQSAESSSLLLIRGKPGSGKSTLAKHVLKILESTRGDTEDYPKTLVAHFFYSFRGGKIETSHKVMLQSILCQILDQEHSLYPLFRDHYRAQRRSSGPNFQWEMPALTEILKSLANIKMDLRLYIILDAMDESDGMERHDILDAMMTLCSSRSKCVVKGLVTTRPLPRKDFEPRIDDFPSLILEDKNRNDIGEIVDREIKRITTNVTSEDHEIETTIFDGIKKHIKVHADGVFLWVTMVLKEVENLANEGFSKTDLDQLYTILPPELEDLYKRIVERLARNSSEDRIKLGRKLLALAAFSLRRLTIDELRDAIVVPSILDVEHLDTNQAYLNGRIKLLERRIPLACGDLLEIKKPFVQMVHESVRKFLLSEQKIAKPFDTDEQRGVDEIASVCIRYMRLSLSHQVLERASVCTERTELWTPRDYEAFVQLLDDRPLLDYAISSLQRHLEVAKSERISAEWFSFLEQAKAVDSARYFLWETLMPLTKGSVSDLQKAAANQFRAKLLIFAAMGNYRRAIKSLITAGTAVDCIDEETGVFPLLVAVSGGHEEVVELLLDLNANGNAKDRYGETALHKVAASGQESIAKMLLRKGVYVDAESLLNERPLHLASVHGNHELVTLLIENNADVDAMDRYGGRPLHRAAANGHHKIAELLINEDAYINADAQYGGTPLHRAVENGDEAMVSLLLDRGASVLWSGHYGGTALHCASAGGLVGIVSLLLDHGANVDLRDRYGWRPLDWATVNGYKAVVQLLQGNRRSSDGKVSKDESDCNRKGKDYKEPLYGISNILTLDSIS